MSTRTRPKVDASQRESRHRNSSRRDAPRRLATQRIYTSSFGHTEAEAQIIGKELERLASVGKSTSADIVEAATPDDSPLHPYFLWDDAEAARQHRLNLARHLARHIHVTVVDSRGNQHKVRAFHAVHLQNRDNGSAPAASKSYLHVETIRTDPDYRAQVIAQAKAALYGWRERNREYAEIFADVFAAIDRLKEDE